MISKISALFVIAFITNILSPLSQAGSYNFGGSCPSQGAWTQIALRQAANIAEVIKQLKDNPACKGIESILGDLQAAQSLLETPTTEIAQESKLQTLPIEINALRNSVLSGGNVNSTASNLLMNRTLQAAKLSSQLSATEAAPPVDQMIGPSGGMAIKSLFRRFANPTRKGMDLMNRVFQTLPQFDSCLMGRPNQGLALLGGAVKIAAAFSAAGEGVGNHLGDVIANLAKMLRDRTFTQALRAQDETEFWFSISCLLESSAKNYCDAENAQELLQYSRDQYQEAMKRNLQDRKGPTYDNPLEGYYLLVRELPLIASWLQQVQFGVTPKLASDAAFKNKIWDQVTDLTKAVNALTGYFNEQMLFLGELTDSNAKRNQLFRMLETLVGRMTGGEDGSAGSAQFFTTTVNPNLLPFYLIGMDTIPKECRSNSDGRFPMEWDSWMKTGGADGGFQAQFNDPNKLASVIQSRMNEIVAGASMKSSAYFRQRLIVDMPNLVNQTLTGDFMTVRRAFESVQNYLVRFESKLRKDNMDLVIIPSVRETRIKISRFLKSYETLRNLGQKMVNSPEQTPALLAEVDTAAKNVIDTIFNEFNILFQKDTFLTNRLTTYIDKDFSMRIKSGLNMTPYQEDLMVITQRHLLEKLTEVHGVNPTNALQDLYQAQVINRRNLQTLEDIFKDSLYRIILEVKSVAEGKPASYVAKQLQEKFEKDRGSFRSAAIYSAPGMAVWNWLTAGTALRNAHPDLYQQTDRRRAIRGVDDQFGSFAQFQAKLCSQSLIFDSRGSYQEICQGSILKSFYSGKNATGLDLVYDQFISDPTSASQIRKNPRLASKNICAYQHFIGRNMVKWLQDADAEALQEATEY